MIKSDDVSLGALNSLLPVCHDGQAGYETAATDVKDPELRRLFGEIAAQRMKFTDQLTARVRTLRGEPVTRGSLAGAAHRKWIDMVGANATAQAHAILAECERADDIALKEYRTALQLEDLDLETRRIVQVQYEQVQAAHDRVRQLRDSPTYGYR